LMWGHTTVVNVQMIPSDKGQITGRVTDAITGAGIASAAVSVTDGSGNAYSGNTDANGNFALVIGEGAFSGTVAKTGYATATISGTVVNGQATTVNVSLTAYTNPVITNVQVTNISGVSVTISWTTDQFADSRVEYGPVIPYDNASYNALLVRNHSIVLSGLSGGTTYHFRVVSANNLGMSSASEDSTFQTSLPPFTVRYLGDAGNVAVMEVTGNYDASFADGSLNVQPRQAVAAQYFAAHGDIDFLVVLSTFDYSMPEAGAKGFYLEVKNDTQGINRTLFNNTSFFGSAGRLQGVIESGNVTSLAASPYGTLLDETLGVLDHELMHRFGAYVRYRKPDGSISTGLLGRDSAHWSYLLDTKGSLMYGNGWRDNGNGTFTSTAKQSVLSPLDLYLMGMIPKEQVPPILLIDNTAIDATQLPQLGATVFGTATTVTIDDIVSAEGERIPNSTASQKQFTGGFVLLIRPGDSTETALQAIELLRKAFAGRFAELTQLKGSIGGIAPEIILHVDAPANGATVTGPDVTVTGTVINTTGAETGITINGIPATVFGSQFLLHHVPLQEGANTLTVTATDNISLTANATVNVTSSQGHYLRIRTNLESGLVPLEVAFHLYGSFSAINPTVTISGPVPVTMVAGADLSEFTAQFPAEGSYTVTASATGPDGQTYGDTVTIIVLSRFQMDSRLRAKWGGMKAAMALMDVEKAVSFFLPDSQDRYSGIFTALGSILPQVAQEMQEIELISLENGLANYRIRRMKAGALMTYYIYFVIDDSDGIWKIKQF